MEYSVPGKKILSIPHLSIEKGTTYGIMGPNGAGKSTLLKFLSLLDSPTKGIYTSMVKKFLLRKYR